MPQIPECPEMVVIPAGHFEMGSHDGDDEEKPVHRVTIPQPFAARKYAVTRGEFAAFLEATGYEVGPGCQVWAGSVWEWDLSKGWADPGFRQTDDDPVVCVSWKDASAYTTWLSDRTGQQYRLLSEAEWEYAARAGTITRYWWGNEIGCDNANCEGCGSRWDRKQTAPAGSFRANPFGLHDVHGNVWEWVYDCWSDDYRDAPVDGNAWTGGDRSRRVLRGGSWFSVARYLTSSFRVGYDIDSHEFNFGFRVARTLSP